MAWKPLNNLNKRITFLDSQTYETDAGSQIQKESAILTVWSAIKSVKAEEIKSTIGSIAKRHIVFLVRSDNPDLKQVQNYMKVKYQEDVYEIDFILWSDPQSGYYSEIWCSL